MAATWCSGESSLITALGNDATEEQLWEMIDAGADIDEIDNFVHGMSFFGLLLCSVEKYRRSIKLLLRIGVQVDPVDDATIVADNSFELGSEMVLRALIDYGIDLCERDSDCRDPLRCVLENICDSNTGKMVKILLDAGTVTAVRTGSSKYHPSSDHLLIIAKKKWNDSYTENCVKLLIEADF